MWRFLVASAALALTAALSGCGGSEDLSVELQRIDDAGPNPFTESVGTGKPLSAEAPADERNAPSSGQPSADEEGGEGGSGQALSGAYEGGEEGLYGDTDADVHCDKDALISQLNADEAKSRAWAEARGISPAEVEPAIQKMTPVLLRSDTLVTNHGYLEGGDWEPFLALLQAGSAVLVDEYGAPAVRCECGNPLVEPEVNGDVVDPGELPEADSPEGQETYKGEPWEGYTPEKATVVTPSKDRLTEIVATDVDTGEYRYLEVADEGDDEAEPGQSPDPSMSPGYPEESPTYPGEESPGYPQGTPGEDYDSGEGGQMVEEPAPEGDAGPAEGEY